MVSTGKAAGEGAVEGGRNEEVEEGEEWEEYCGQHR